MSDLDTSFFCAMQDVLANGPAGVCDTVQAAGVGGLTVAVSYHASVDFRPHGTRGRIEEFPAGAQYFPTDAALYADSPVQPWVPEPYAERNLLGELRAETRRRGMSLTAWTVFGFNERAGRADPGLCQLNVYGDRYVTDLCPANPGVQRWCTALAGDVTRSGVDWLLAESLHFSPLREGRRFLRLDAAARLAFGLCFCEHCERAATGAGVDLPAVRRWARAAADEALAGTADGPEQLGPAEVAELADGAVAAFLQARTVVVRDLVAVVSAVVAAAGGRLMVMDQVAAGPRVLGPTAVDAALQYGVDVAAIGRVAPGYMVLGYTTGPAPVRADVDAYRARLPADTVVRVALRPSWPDCETTADLTAKLDTVRSAGVAGVDFYHLGLVPDAAVDRVRAVLPAAAG